MWKKTLLLYICVVFTKSVEFKEDSSFVNFKSFINNNQTFINNKKHFWGDILTTNEARILSKFVELDDANDVDRNKDVFGKFFENHNENQPLAILVDDTHQSRDVALRFFKKISKIGYKNYFFMKFNSSGVTGILEPSQNLEHYLQNDLLEAKSYIGPEASNGTAAFFAMLNAANSLQKNSDILLIIDRSIIDEDISFHTAKFLISKNIKVYVFWGGVYPTKAKEETILQNLCQHTNGLFIINNENLSGYNFRKFLEMDIKNTSKSVLLMKNNIFGKNTFSFQIGSNVTSFHIKLCPNIQSGTLTSPNGKTINILNGNEVAFYSDGSFVNKEIDHYEVHLKTTQGGKWTLTMDASTLCNVTIYVDSKLTTSAKIRQNDAFHYGTYGYNNEKIFPKPQITIEVGQNSKLLVTPGQYSEIFIEVTSFDINPVEARFQVSDEKYFLINLDPWRAILNPQETKVVTVKINPKFNTVSDLLTFHVRTSSLHSKQIKIDVGSSYKLDDLEPEINYRYLSDCTNILIGKCDLATWTIEVSAKDTGSGILQLTSKPQGLNFPTEFQAGTNEEVTGYYSDWCCNPDLQIIATDRAHNQKVWNVNAYRALWSAGAIAAMILGLILLILVIIAIVYCCKACCNKEGSFTLPRYRGRY